MKIKISFLVFGLINILVCHAQAFPTPAAKFTFEGKPFIGTAILTNTIIQSNALYLNGEYSSDYWGDEKQSSKGYTAVFRPAIFHYDKFTVVFKARPEDTSGQKRTLLVGGPSFRWLVLSIRDQNHLELSLNNHAFHHLIENVTITNGEWSVLAVSFDLKARKVIVYFNGARAAQISLPPDFVLEIMNDTEFKEYDKAWTFTNYSYGGTFQGLVAGLLTFDTILSDEQVKRLFPKS
jgi:hypothetical protein